MRGLALDSSHDLSLDSGGSFVNIDGVAATGQEIRTRLLLLLGENFLDTREGVPYLTEILIKGVSTARIRAIIRQAIASVPSIVEVTSITVSLDRMTRTVTINWSARTDTGKTLRSSDYAPLVIE